MRRTRMGRPSLIGTAARTAVIAGTATAVSGAVAGSMQKSAQQKAAAQQAAVDAQQPQGESPVQADAAPVQAEVAPAPDTPAVQSTQDQLAQLQKLGELYQSGVLSDEEFAAMKAKILQ